MITEDLVIYIQTQTKKNILKNAIISKLQDAGWHTDDIDEAFNKLIPTKREVKQGPDLYRESPLVGNKEEIVSKPFLAPKIEPLTEKPVFSNSFSEANSKNLTPSYYIPDNVIQGKNKIVDKEFEPNLNFGIMKPKLVQIPPIEEIVSIPKDIKPEPYNEEFIPTLKPKVSELPLENQDKVTASKFIFPSAILHSYPQVLLSSKETNNEPVVGKRKVFIKWLLIILGVSFIIGIVFALVFNYSNLKSFSSSFIKKDPKVLLANAAQILSSLKSYKIQTNATISIPLFADITNGLVNGEAISSRDKDFISLSAEGIVKNNQIAPTFDYLATFKSSFFKNDIVSNIKYSDDKTFVYIPDLTLFLGKNTPPQSTILVEKGQFNLITDLLPRIIQNKINKVNIDKLLSIGLPSYITNETALIFKEFIAGASVIEKPVENVRNIPTYHYILVADRQSSKIFLNKFVSVFLNDLSVDEKTLLDESIGSTTIDGFEIWIGKDDGNIHQYKFNLSIPLSKIIGLDDKGIAGNVVSLSWKTTYYDFDIDNDISLPTSSIGMTDFLKNINDMKIKNLILSFKALADNMHNAIGSFGKRSNPTGSCTNPNSSSLFSPVGHTKGASNAVGNIAEAMNNILTKTNGALSCYSTSDAWAVSTPLISDPTSSFCFDSIGNNKILTTPLTGTICK